MDRIVQAVLAWIMRLVAGSGSAEFPTAASAVTLYHAAGSPYSQMVRLALIEKRVAWTSRLLEDGDVHDPWYARINPDLMMPALQCGDVVVTDSARIVRYIDSHFDGPRLSPDMPEERLEMERWIDLEASVSLRDYQYGCAKGPLARSVLSGFKRSMDRLEQLRDANPDLADVYSRKLEDHASLCATVTDPERVEAMDRRVNELLDALEARLAGRTWLVGERYGLADIVWTGWLARLAMLGAASRWRRGRRANVDAYWRRVVSRPSFREADVWDRLQPRALDRIARPLLRWLFRCAEPEDRG